MHLATFLHISDLHFGLIEPGSFDARAPQIWAKLPWLEGLLGHRHRSLVRLRDFFFEMRRGESDTRLIVTGDLTTMGNSEEFDTADEFLKASLWPPRGNDVGLHIPQWKCLAIPGNHDHWPGWATTFGPETSAFRKHFPGFPIVRLPIPLVGGHSVRFLLIDTDFDVWCVGWNRFLARGSFTSQLTDLARKLGKESRPEKEIRVLCLHHSRAHVGRTLRMEDASRDALNDFIVNEDIAVLLCGHIHTPLVKSFRASHEGRSVHYLEARCGTTTLSDIPYRWRTIRGHRPRRPKDRPNSLLVHRLFERNGEVWWQTEVYLELSGGFSKGAKLPKSVLACPSFRVWPRS